MRLDDLDGAASIVDSGLYDCKDQGSSHAAWSLRLIRADLLRLRGRTEEALSYLSVSEAAFPPESCDLRSLIGLKKTRGYCLGQLGRYAASHGFLGEAEQLARDAGLLEMQCEVQQCQAMVFYLQRDYESSDRIFRLILEAAPQIGGWYFRASALWGIGKNLMIQGNHEAALPWLEESLALFESVGARLSIAIAWSEMAVCHLGLGDDKRSLELLEKALEVQSAAGTVQNYLVALANIGNVYLHRCNYLTAIEYYRRALGLAREIKDPVSISKWSHNIRLAYARLRESIDQVRPETT
jgi:tetratricopeptide (TPR) repeat protein